MVRRVPGGAVVASGAAVAIFAAGCGGAIGVGDDSGETVLIAADLELTGEGSQRGEVFREALALRIEQVNEQGLLGDRELALEVLDNRSDRATAAGNLSDIARDTEVAVAVTGGCGECTLAAVDVLAGEGLPTLSLASADAVAEPVAKREFLYKLGPSAGDTARILGDELDSREAESVAVYTTDDMYGDEAQEALAGAAERAGAEVAVSETVSGDEDDIADAAAAAVEYQASAEASLPGLGEESAESGVDVVVIALQEPSASALAGQLRQQGYDGDLLLDATAADELFLSGPSAEALEGAHMVFTETLVIDEVIASSPAKAERQNWFNEYTARQGTYHAYSSFAADAVDMVAQAVAQTDDLDRRALNDAIGSLQFEGVSGPMRIHLESHAALASQALTVLVAQGDRWRLAS